MTECHIRENETDVTQLLAPQLSQTTLQIFVYWCFRFILTVIHSIFLNDIDLIFVSRYKEMCDIDGWLTDLPP